jgi:RES domain
MTSARRLIAPEPPADLAKINLPLAPVRRQWFRMTADKERSPLHWSRLGRYRFDSSSARWGVCYLAESVVAAFQEIWGDQIRSRRLDWHELERKIVWQITVSSSLRTIELAGETLITIKGTLQCFTGSYPKSQRWGAVLMDHPAELDGLQYLGRRSGRHCVALFGDEKNEKPHQKEIVTKKLGQLSQWKGLWPFLDRIRVRVAHLPAKPPAGTWE